MEEVVAPAVPVVVPARIRDDDPRLGGTPAGGVFRCRDNSWWVRISKGPRGAKRAVSSAYVHKRDHNGDMSAAKKAGDNLLRQVSNDLGLTINKCIVLENGNIKMDTGNGHYMIFSPGKLDRFILHTWCFAKEHAPSLNVYAVAWINKKFIRAHRFITNAIEGQQVDHISGDTSLNTDENLRIASLQVNAQNHKLTTRNTTGENGVSFWDDGDREYYVAHWYNNKKTKTRYFPVAQFMTSDDAFAAAVAYRRKIEKLLGIQSRRVSLGQVVDDADMEDFVEYESTRATEEQLIPQRKLVVHLFNHGISVTEAAVQIGAKLGTVKIWYYKLSKGLELMDRPKRQPADNGLHHCQQCSYIGRKHNLSVHISRIHRKRSREADIAPFVSDDVSDDNVPDTNIQLLAIMRRVRALEERLATIEEERVTKRPRYE